MNKLLYCHNLWLFRHHPNAFFFIGIVRCDFNRIVQQVYLVECLFKCLQGGVAVIRLQFAFPDDDCVPAEEAELDAFLYITFLVSLYLLLPVLGIALGQYEISAVFVAVPETAVYKDDGSVFAQDDVGGAGEPAHVDSVAVTA